MSFLISKSRSKRSKKLSKPSGPEERTPKRRYLPGLVVGLLAWLMVMGLLYTGQTPQHAGLAPGQRAPATVVAVVDFEYLDLAQTELNMKHAADAVPPVFRIDPRPLKTATRWFEKLFDRLEAYYRAREQEQDASDDLRAVEDVLDLVEIPVTAQAISALVPPEKVEHFRELVRAALKNVWSYGIIAANERASGFQGWAKSGNVLIRRAEAEDEPPPEEVKLEELLVPAEALRTATRHIRTTMEDPSLPEHTLTALLAPWWVPNLEYDPEATQALRQVARRSVEPVMQRVREGTTLIERGDVITAQVLEQLRAHNLMVSKLESPTERRLKMVGNGSILMIALVICTGALRIVRPGILRHSSLLVLLMILTLLALLPARGLLYLSTTTRFLSSGLTEFLVPLALPPLLATILIGGPSAVVLGLWTSFAAAVMFSNSFTVFTMGLIATVLAAYSARDVRRRSRVFRAGVTVGLGGMLYAVSLAALNQPAGSVVALQTLSSLGIGLACAGVALLLVPLFEFLFDITTDIKLLEYSDLGHPLLQRLAREAPGTYHHSLMVADLGRAAASAIGASELLVRVCAYFHDIGKLTKPEFFAENQQYRGNPHDDLAPSVSTLIITAHVKEGVALAKQYRLPYPIIEGIQQHHGTSLISYFYHRAKQQQEHEEAGRPAPPPQRVNEGDFRYEGPKPTSREMAILLLADSVEAASRSMSKPTPSRIEALVKAVIETRREDGQLDDCGLTFAELSRIQRSLIFTLTSMLHGRVEYPQNESRSKQPPEKAPRRVAEREKTHAVVHGAGTTA